MDIPAFLAAKGLSQEAFAKQLGVSQGLVWQWLSGKTRITAERAKEIEDATEGAVTRQDLRPDIFGPVVPPTAPAEPARAA